MHLRPMLARPGELPTGHGWAHEVKWDGFRCLVATENALRVRSRRGWNASGVQTDAPRRFLATRNGAAVLAASHCALPLSLADD